MKVIFLSQKYNFQKKIFIYFKNIFSEHDFSIYSASNIAASSIAASLSGLNWHVKSRISIYDLVDKLAELSESESVSKNKLNISQHMIKF